MTTKQYLSQIERLDSLIKNRQTEISNLWDLVTNISVPMETEKVQTSGSKDRIGNIMSKIADLEAERNAFIDKYMEIKENSIYAMEKLSDIRYYRMLFKRYIEYKELHDISSDMGYTYGYAKKLHREALDAIENTRLLKVDTKKNQKSPKVPFSSET